MATYKPVLHSRKKPDGTSLIMIRITKNRKRSYLSTEYYVKETDWNKKGEVRSTCQMHKVYNSGIQKLIRECQEEETKSLLQSTKTTGIQIKAKVKGSGKTFQSLALSYIESKPISPRSIQRYKDHLTAFIDCITDLPVDNITNEVVRKYESVALNKRSENTVKRGLGMLSEIWQHLSDTGIIFTANPFKKSSIKAKKVEKQRLTIEEIQKIKNIELFGAIAISRDVFMLQYYLGGLRISDVLLLKKKSIQSGRIEYSDMKTGRQQSHLIPAQAVEILSKYNTETPYVLPLMKLLPDSPKYLKQIESKTAQVNTHLRKIAQQLEITKHISSHVARHSFADHLRQSDTSIYTISKALGHSSVKMTENYLASFDTKAVDDAVSKLFE